MKGAEAVILRCLLAQAAPPAPQRVPRLLPPPRRLRRYRGATLALLRRYYRLSFAIGRLPSLLGREVFRSRLSAHHKAPSFEDAVIFVHDVERCLGRLDSFSQLLIARIVLQEYTHDEAAYLAECTRRNVEKQFPRALDRLTQAFLEAGMLVENSCQAPLLEVSSGSDWEERK